MRIRELAKKIGVSAEWLRQLERQGRIPHAARDRNGHRRYTEADAIRLRGLLVRRPDNGTTIEPKSGFSQRQRTNHGFGVEEGVERRPRYTAGAKGETAR